MPMRFQRNLRNMEGSLVKSQLDCRRALRDLMCRWRQHSSFNAKDSTFPSLPRSWRPHRRTSPRSLRASLGHRKALPAVTIRRLWRLSEVVLPHCEDNWSTEIAGTADPSTLVSLEMPTGLQGFTLQLVGQCDQFVDARSAALTHSADDKTGNILHTAEKYAGSRLLLLGNTTCEMDSERVLVEFHRVEDVFYFGLKSAVDQEMKIAQ